VIEPIERERCRVIELIERERCSVAEREGWIVKKRGPEAEIILSN